MLFLGSDWQYESSQWLGTRMCLTHSLRPGQDGRHFADDSFTCIFFNENCCILIKFSLKYVRKGSIDNNRALVQIMAWRRSGDKPLSEPMTGKFGAHIYASLGLNELNVLQYSKTVSQGALKSHPLSLTFECVWSRCAWHKVILSIDALAIFKFALIVRWYWPLNHKNLNIVTFYQFHIKFYLIKRRVQNIMKLTVEYRKIFCVCKPVSWVIFFILAKASYTQRPETRIRTFPTNWHLTHCGLVTAYDAIDLGQHRLR